MLNEESDHSFQGFASPNYTPVPDELFDELLPKLSGSELKVLLYVIRRTFGFKRDADQISLSQMLQGIVTEDGRILDRGTGIKDKKTLLDAINKLEAKRILLTQRRKSAARGNEPTTYRLNVLVGEEEKKPPPLGGKPRQGIGGEIPPSPWGENPATQETEKQETDFDPSNFERPPDQPTTTTGRRTDWGGGPAPHDQAANALADRADRADRAPLMPLGEILRQRQQATAAIGDGPAAHPASVGPTGPATPRRQGRPPGTPDEREALAAFLGDFARELGDEAPLSSTITRVLTLLQTAQLPPDQWGDVLYQARTITQERTAQIRTLAADGGNSMRRKNKMPYFLAVLADVLGLAEDQPTAPSS